MSNSVRPQRRKPTRLPRPWDSPGKNTGVGCHFLLQCMKLKSESQVAQSCLTLSYRMDCSLPGSLYKLVSISQFIPTFPTHRPHPPSTLPGVRLFAMSVSLFLLCRYVHLYCFSRFHIYALINNVIFLFLTSLCVTVSRSANGTVCSFEEHFHILINSH